MDKRTDVAVIGGGVVGLCAAYFLARDGHRVTVFDARHDGGASCGNAGMIVPSHVVPLAAPGVVAKGLRWLLNPESPFYIKLRPDLSLLRWLWQFRSHCTGRHVSRSAPVLRNLSLASVELLEHIVSVVGPQAAYSNSGLLMLHHSEKGREDNLEAAAIADEVGLDVQRLDRKGVRELDPEIRTPYEGGVFYPQDGRIDPGGLISALKRHLLAAGVSIQSGARIERFERQGRRVIAVGTSAELTGADEVVLAAGAWTASLSRILGIRMPVQPAKGYSITSDAGVGSPRVPHILTEEKLTVTPLPGRLRFGGTLALTGFDNAVDVRRTQPLLRLAALYGDRPSEEDVWYGYRPCSPDGLPFIGRIATLDNVTAITGHGMMGVTLAPITGQLAAELVHGTPPSIDVTPFRPDRFA